MIRFLIITLLGFWSTFLWAQTFCVGLGGGASDGDLQDFAIRGDTIIVVGMASSHDSAMIEVGYVAGVTLSGELLWQKHWDLLKADYNGGLTVARLNNGNFLFFGGSGDGVYGVPSYVEIIAQGDTVWTGRVIYASNSGNVGEFIMRSAWISPSGDVWLVGTVLSEVLLQKFDPETHTLLLQKSIGSGTDQTWEDGQSIAALPDGRLIIAGHEWISGNSNVSYAFVMCVDTFGNINWVRRFRFDMVTGVAGAVVSPDGKIFLGGWTMGSGLGDMFIIQLDSAGSVLNSFYLSSPLTFEEMADIYFDTRDNTILIAGRIQSDDPFIGKLDTTGNFLWIYKYWGSGVINRIKAVPGGYVAVGRADMVNDGLLVRLDMDGNTCCASAPMVTLTKVPYSPIVDTPSYIVQALAPSGGGNGISIESLPVDQNDLCQVQSVRNADIVPTSCRLYKAGNYMIVSCEDGVVPQYVFSMDGKILPITQNNSGQFTFPLPPRGLYGIMFVNANNGGTFVRKILIEP